MEFPSNHNNFEPKHFDAILARIAEIKQSHPDNNIAIQVFDRNYFNTLNESQKLRLLKCLNAGLQNPDCKIGSYAMNTSDYVEFMPFFQAVIEKHHKVDLSKLNHTSSWDLSQIEDLPSNGILDITELSLPEVSMRIRVARNIEKYPLPGIMTKEHRINFEKDMKAIFDTLTTDPNYAGKYYSLTPDHECFINQKEYNKLVDSHYMFKNMTSDSNLVAAGIANDWPYGRACYISADKESIVWIGEEDHLRIMCMKKGSVLNQVFDKLKNLVDLIESRLENGCKKSDVYGVVTSCPTNIGTSMRVSVHIPLPNLTSDGTVDKVIEICEPLGLAVRGIGGEGTPIGVDGTVDISPSKRFCVSEAEILNILFKGIRLLKEKEDQCPKMSGMLKSF